MDFGDLGKGKAAKLRDQVFRQGEVAVRIVDHAKQIEGCNQDRLVQDRTLRRRGSGNARIRKCGLKNGVLLVTAGQNRDVRGGDFLVVVQHLPV